MSAVPDYAAPVAILFGLLALAYLGMWRGWRRRSERHDLPPLVPAPPVGELPPAKLQAGARYFGTTVSDHWLERVTARGLGARSSARLSLSSEGLDVVRLAGSFRIPTAALRGARHDQGIAGKVIPPHGVLVVTWQHGDLVLDTGFRLEPPRPDKGNGAPPTISELHSQWVRSISKLVRDHKEHTA
ncbi:MAG TPA: hypothetical protein VFZ64_05020 [Nocardioidaceae bacterium]